MSEKPDSPGRSVLVSVDAASATRSTAAQWVVRVRSEADLTHLKTLPRQRVAWVEVPLELADREELNDFSVDVLLDDPNAQASLLYGLAGKRDPELPRLSIPSTHGVGDAAVIGMGLHYPIRIVPVQPTPAQVAELEVVLERYLRDGRATRAIEPFHSALATLLHGDGATLWDAVEHDPADYQREPPLPGLESPDSVNVRRDRLVADGAECAGCSLLPWCAGWFKWPDPDYNCADVRNLFGKVEQAAAELRADLGEAMEIAREG